MLTPRLNSFRRVNISVAEVLGKGRRDAHHEQGRKNQGEVPRHLQSACRGRQWRLGSGTEDASHGHDREDRGRTDRVSEDVLGHRYP